jgi:hypothetical protein
MHALLPEKTKSFLEAWMTVEASETAFLPGSFFHLVPEILSGSSLLRGVTIMDLPGHWECGAYLCQGGYLDVVARIGRMVKDDLDRLGVKRVITALDAVHFMFTRFHPEENGIRFGQEIVNFHQWILQRIEAREITMGRNLGQTVTLHDNCYAKAGGTFYFEQARRLLDRAGVRVVEMRNHHADALCCGFGRGAGWKRNFQIPFDILQGTMKRIKQAEETGADTLVTYCAGCLWLFLIAAELAESPIRIVHLIELVREAMGERVEFPREERAWDILTAMTYKILQEAGRKNVWIQEVKAEVDPARWNRRPQMPLKAFRRSMNNPLGRQIVRSTFRGLARMLRHL